MTRAARTIVLTAFTVAYLQGTGSAARGAPAPDWVATLGKSAAHPPQTFVSGFGMSPDDRSMKRPDKITYASNMARKNLAEALSVAVTSEQIIKRFSVVVDGDEDLVDDYRSTVVARSDLDLDGVEVEVYTSRDTRPVYALAYLHKARTAEHYRTKFAAKMKRLVELQKQGNGHLAARNVARARATYTNCDRLVGEIEEIIMIRELLGGGEAISSGDLERVMQVRSTSRELWEKIADTLEEAAQLLAMKIRDQVPGEGRVQVNALMLDDTYQYSQFSSRFRTILERQLDQQTELRALLASELDFTPGSSRIARFKVVANGADFLLSGSYFLRDDLIHIYVRLSDAEKNDIVASADARVKKAAAADLQLQPRNYLQALADRRVFRKDEIVGGGLNLEAWTNRGVDGLALEDGEDLKIYVRANKPCFVRFIYHLNNGARVIPDRLYMNYVVDVDKVNRVVELPDTFTICAPFGAETMQFFASTERFDDIQLVPRVFEGETYDVVAESLAKSNVRYRGIKRKRTGVEVAEMRLPLTTVPK